MEPPEVAHIRLVIEDALSEAEAAIAAQVEAVMRQQSAAGMLQSGNTVFKSLAVLREIAEHFLKTSAERVAAIRKTPDDFAMLADAVERCLERCGERFQSMLASVKHTLDSKFEADCMALFAQMRADIERKLQIQRFAFRASEQPASFTQSTSSQISSEQEPSAMPSEPSPDRKKNFGGRPPAAFWDQLWAEMAGQLYEGKLQPKRQAHIEDAMKQWLSQADHDCADSNIRRRAQLLWQRINRPEN